jgi:hypothetical protein
VGFGEEFNVFIRKIDPWGDSTVAAQQWMPATEKVLRKVGDVKTGKILLQAIFKTRVVVSVEPLVWKECNAHGSAARFVLDNRTFNAIVKFDAAVYAKGSDCFKTHVAEKYNRGGKPDEVLFHELVHAFRGGMRTLGLNVPYKTDALTGGLWRYSNAEEFFAVLLTNIYVSDVTNRNSSGLRAGHRGKAPLESYFSHSLCFFASSSQILPLLKDFQKEHTNLFAELAEVKATFNPIRMMVKNPSAVERISKAKATIDHEKGAEKHQKWLEDKRLAEVRASIQKHAAQTPAANNQKQLDDLINSIANASPEQIAEQLGRLGKYARDVIDR